MIDPEESVSKDELIEYSDLEVLKLRFLVEKRVKLTDW